MIYLAGDLHGEIDYQTISNRTFKKQGEEPPNLNDIIINIGDFGAIWDQEDNVSKTEQFLKKWYKSKPWKLVTCGGNHENWNRIFKLPLVWVDWLDGYAYKYLDNIYYAKRGTVYTIENKTFLFAGGAASHDAKYRKEGISIWADLETMSQKERDEGMCSLEKYKYRVDYVISHTAPRDILNLWGFYSKDIYDPTPAYLDSISRRLEFKRWFFGHLHIDKKYGKYNCLYKELIKLEEEQLTKNEIILVRNLLKRYTSKEISEVTTKRELLKIMPTLKWVTYDFNKYATRPLSYGKYLVIKDNNVIQLETWNGIGWSKQNNIKFWAKK